MPFTLTSPGFSHQGDIPMRYTCEGEDLSPPLAWSGLPEGTKSLVLIVDDPDAPDPRAPRRIWAHWGLYNIPPTQSSLPEGVKSSTLPEGTLVIENDWKRAEYNGPCPPIGRHRYFFKLFALDTTLPRLKHPDKKTLEEAMKGHILGQAELVGTYERKR